MNIPTALPGRLASCEQVSEIRRDRLRTIFVIRDLKEVGSKSHPLLALHKTKGYLGLQNHSSVVRFRNLRLGPHRDILLP